jgi:hypothetical protein
MCACAIRSWQMTDGAREKIMVPVKNVFHGTANDFSRDTASIILVTSSVRAVLPDKFSNDRRAQW